MPAAPNQLSAAVEWSEELHTLVFETTRFPVGDFWGALRADRGVHGFLSDHPDLPARLVVRLMAIAQKRLTDWPDTAEDQLLAYGDAKARGDMRFTHGRMKFTRGVRGGNLTAGQGYVQASIIWSYLSHGATFAEIEYGYRATSDDVTRLIDVAEQLISEGLVTRADLPGRGRAPGSEETPG
jgi:uncharacterized protein (DUF433 family)